MHLDSSLPSLPVDLQEQFLLPLRRDLILLLAAADGHEEKEMKGSCANPFGKVEDIRNLGNNCSW